MELLNLCHDLIDHAGDHPEEIQKAKEALEGADLGKLAEQYAEDHMGEIAVKVLMNIGIPFVGAELVGLAIDKYNESKKETNDTPNA